MLHRERTAGTLWLLPLTAALILACDAGSFVTSPEDDREPAALRLYANVASHAVAGLSVEVAAPDIDPSLVFNIPITDDVASGTVRVPAGSDRAFTVRAFDANGLETHRGGDTVSIVAGQNPPLEITLAPLHGDQDITATIGSFIVAVSPAADTILVGNSTQLAAAVIDSLGDTISDATVHWATLDPDVATVDSQGLVTGRGGASTSIVATYGSVGGRSDIRVEDASDTEAPSVPTNLSAAAVSSSQIDLTWSASSDNVGVAGYYVYRDGGQVADVGDTAYGDAGLSASTSYTYEVAAYDAAGNMSDRSTSVSATTQDPSSGVISDIAFDFSTHQRLAPGSDNWPLTWADDGHQYTNWGDGGGFGGTNSNGRVSLGVGRVGGAKDAYTGYNVNGGANAENPSSFSDGKSTTMFFIDGTLYMLVSPHSFFTDCGATICAYERQQLWKSTDYGATWSEVTGVVWLYGDGETLGFHHFINMGQAYTDAIDGYVYVSAIEIQDDGASQIQAPGELILMRVPATTAAIEDKSQYEYFSGTPGSPAWSSSFADRAPVLTDADGFMRHSITYIPPLERFLMLGPHTGDDTGNLKVWEAPKPWGPWTLVREWRQDNGTGWTIPGEVQEWFFWDVSPKWISPDGLSIVVVATGKQANDSWNTIEATLTVK